MTTHEQQNGYQCKEKHTFHLLRKGRSYSPNKQLSATKNRKGRTLLYRKTPRPTTLICKATTLVTKPRRKRTLFIVNSFEDKNPGESIKTETQVTNNVVTTLLCQAFG